MKPVDVETVTRGPLEVTVEAEGMTRIREVYQVSAPLAGCTARSPVEVGDPVTGIETVVAAWAARGRGPRRATGVRSRIRHGAA